MFLVWAGEPYRPTKDMDLSASRKRTADELAVVFKELCGAIVEEDGLLLSPDTVEVEPGHRGQTNRRGSLAARVLSGGSDADRAVAGNGATGCQG